MEAWRTTNAGTWAPRAEKKAEKAKRAEEAPGGASKRSKSLKDPLGEPPPWFKDAQGGATPEWAAPALAVSTGEEGSSSTPVEAQLGSPSEPVAKDEITLAVPKLAEHIKTPAKFIKVATMACSLLEDGRVNLNNSEAFFEVLEAGMSDPKRIREKANRVACRALYNAAIVRKEVFALKRQATLRLWQMRVINQIDLFSKEPEIVLRICREIRQGLMILPCLDPSLEPPARSGARREMMPAAARPVWCLAIFECLAAAMSMYEHEWARNDLNMLVKTAHDRRQNFTDEQAAAVLHWNRKRKDGSGELAKLFG